MHFQKWSTKLFFGTPPIQTRALTDEDLEKIFTIEEIQKDFMQLRPCEPYGYVYHDPVRDIYANLSILLHKPERIVTVAEWGEVFKTNSHIDFPRGNLPCTIVLRKNSIGNFHAIPLEESGVSVMHYADAKKCITEQKTSFFFKLVHYVV